MARKSQLDPVVQCFCAKCSSSTAGYQYQKRSLTRIHGKNYPITRVERTSESLPSQPIEDLARTDDDRQREYSPNAVPLPRTNPSNDQLFGDDTSPPPNDESLLGLDEPRLRAYEDSDDELEQFGQFGQSVQQAQYGDRPSTPPRTPTPPENDRILFRPVRAPQIPTPDEDQAQADRPHLVPAAFNEAPAVRMAYLTAVMANVYGHLTIEQATNQLNSTLDSLAVAGVLPLIPRPVRTLISARRRLGLDPDQWITQYCICTECWKHYSPAELELLDSPLCMALPGCTGKLYTDSWDSRKNRIRTATKIHPQTSVISTLRRMMMRPGFARSLRDNRDRPAGLNGDEDFVMTDIHDGDAWNEQVTGCVRELGENGVVLDAPVDGTPPPKNLNERRYGLHLTMNGDWYVLPS